MAAKRFLFVSLGILAIATAFHIGALSARATTGEVAAAWGWASTTTAGAGYVVTTDGDVYFLNMYGGLHSTYEGNAFTGATPVEKTSWTDVKKKFQR